MEVLEAARLLWLRRSRTSKTEGEMVLSQQTGLRTVAACAVQLHHPIAQQARGASASERSASRGTPQRQDPRTSAHHAQGLAQEGRLAFW